jgi:hypothetical protein
MHPPERRLDGKLHRRWRASEPAETIVSTGDGTAPKGA